MLGVCSVVAYKLLKNFRQQAMGTSDVCFREFFSSAALWREEKTVLTETGDQGPSQEELGRSRW